MDGFFVNQKYRKNGSWVTNVHVKKSRDEAMHQFHAFMSTYAYGNGLGVDYSSCSVEEMDGHIIKQEVDDRIVEEPEEEEAPAE